MRLSVENLGQSQANQNVVYPMRSEPECKCRPTQHLHLCFFQSINLQNTVFVFNTENGNM